MAYENMITHLKVVTNNRNQYWRKQYFLKIKNIVKLSP